MKRSTFIPTLSNSLVLRFRPMFILFLVMCTGFNSFAQAPVNDEPCNAIVIPVSLNCNYVQYTNADATATSGVTDPGCASYSGGDVWFSLTVPASGSVTIDTQTGVVTDGGMAVYTGTCTSLTLLECNDDGSANGLMPLITRNGLTPGSTLWIRVWEFGNNNNGTFSICATLPPPPPANLAPCSATLINAGQTCTYNTYTNAGAPGFNGVPAPGCASYQGGDVWFKAVVPCTGSIDIDAQTGVMTDGGMALYTAPNCNGPFTLIQCNDDGSDNGLMPRITANNLVPFDTIYIRFWEFGNDNNGSFGLCARVPQVGGSGPAGSCQTASAFCAGGGAVSFPSVTGQPNTNGGGIYGCLTTIPNPAYYYLQIQNTGNLSLNISQQNTAGTPIDVDFVAWGPFASLASSCTSISAQNIVDCSYSIAAVENLNIPNAVAGEFYILLVTNFNGAAGTITYAPNPGSTATTNCAIACTLNATNNGPVCVGGTVSLFASNVTNATYSWTGPNCFTSNAQNPTGVVVPTTPGIYTYFVTATGPGGTNCSDTTQVTVLAAPNVGNDTTVIRCAGTTLNLTTIYNTTGLSSTYLFNGSPVANPTAVTLAGVYTVTSGANATCVDVNRVTLILDTVRLTVAAVNATCTTLGSVTGTATSGIAPFQYIINTAPTVFQSSGVFSVSPGTYTITVRDSLGCTASQTATVALNNQLTVSGNQSYSVCRNASAPFTLQSNATSFSWSPAAGLSSTTVLNPTVTPTQPNTAYTLTATLGTCSTTYTVNVSLNTELQVSGNQSYQICNGASIPFALQSNATTYSWSPSVGLSNTNTLNPTANPTQTTTYTLTAGLSPCSTTYSVTVVVVSGITANAGPDLTLLSGESGTLLGAASGGTIQSVLWSPTTNLNTGSVLQPTITAPVSAAATSSTTYTLTVRNTDGCVATDQAIVTFIPYCVRVRNAFTPNNDGNNDNWQVYDSYECLKNVSLSIYNRNGSKIFESRNYRNDWNGTYKGQPSPDGTYYAVIQFTLIDGRVVPVKSDVTIIR